MLVKDIKLSKDDIKKAINKFNEEYPEYISRKNLMMRAIARCSNKSDETLI